MSSRTSTSAKEGLTQIVPSRTRYEAGPPAHRWSSSVSRFLSLENPRRLMTERPLLTGLILALLALVILRGIEIHIGDITINFGK